MWFSVAQKKDKPTSRFVPSRGFWCCQWHWICTYYLSLWSHCICSCFGNSCTTSRFRIVVTPAAEFSLCRYMRSWRDLPSSSTIGSSGPKRSSFSFPGDRPWPGRCLDVLCYFVLFLCIFNDIVVLKSIKSGQFIPWIVVVFVMLCWIFTLNVLGNFAGVSISCIGCVWARSAHIIQHFLEGICRMHWAALLTFIFCSSSVLLCCIFNAECSWQLFRHTRPIE